MKGRGLFLAISHLLYDVALVDGFTSIEEMTEFLDADQKDVLSTIRVLNNIMVAVSEEEYMEVENHLLIQLGEHDSLNRRKERCYPTGSGADMCYTLNPIIFSLIEKGIASAPVYQALKTVVSELLNQWESSAEKGKLSEFTSRISTDHQEGMMTEISRRVVLRETCELTEEEAERLRKFPMTVDMFKRMCAPKFLKAYQLGKKLSVDVAPGDVISYVSRQLGKVGFTK
jgi:hypothetical protein